MDGAIAARRRAGRAPSPVAALTAARAAPFAVPRQPTWASASAPASASHSVTARQSALKIASGMPRAVVESTSTAPATPPRVRAWATSAPWTWRAEAAGEGGPFSGPPISLVSAPPQKRRNVVIVLAVQRAVALGACLAEASPPCGRRARRRRAARGARCARQVHHLAGRLEL